MFTLLLSPVSFSLALSLLFLPIRITDIEVAHDPLQKEAEQSRYVC